MTARNITLWICRIVAAALLLQTLFFKFTGAEESVYIFTQVGIEPWGRYATGVAELVAAILILFPRTSPVGALLAAGIMTGAIASHIFLLGIEVANDHGQLFIYACIVLLASVFILYTQRSVLLSLMHNRRIPV